VRNKYRLVSMAVVSLVCLCMGALSMATAADPLSSLSFRAVRASQPATGSLRVILFQSATCSGCRRTQETLKNAKARFGDRIEVHWENFDDDQDAFRRLFLFEDHYGVKTHEQPPTLFVGETYINGTDEIEKTLNDVIAAELQAGHATFVLPTDGGDSGETAAKADAGLLKRFERFSAGTVFVGGLLDGINPCAFTTIVFLLSVLVVYISTPPASQAGRRRFESDRPLCLEGEH